jgi:hypothetical protein
MTRQMQRAAERERRRTARVPPSRLFLAYHGTVESAAMRIRRGALDEPLSDRARR